MQTVFQRLFECLDTLIPDLPTLTEGQSFYAPPRLSGDMAVHLDVSKVALPLIQLEIAHDEVRGGEDHPAPWLVVRANVDMKTAEILAIHDQWSYEIDFAQKDNRNTLRRNSANLMAVNWLALMGHLGTVFHSTSANLVQEA